MKEQTIQKKIIDYFEARGAYVVKVSLATRSGIPDLLICYKGRFIAIEVKKPGGKPTALQEYNLKRIRAARGEVYVLKCFDEEELERVIQ